MAESIISFNKPAGIRVFIIPVCSVLVLFSAPFLAAPSVASIPSMPVWPLTKAVVHLCVHQDMFLSASAVFKTTVSFWNFYSIFFY